MKKVYLTFDIETIVSKLSYNPNYLTNMLLGAIYIADQLEDRKIKGTFFISLSPKVDEIDIDEYLECMRSLLRILGVYKYIKIEPHLHMKNLPLSFDTKSDIFSDYSLDQQVEALIWAKNFFLSCGVTVESFRPGSYSSNKQYYKALSLAGYKYSSIMRFDQIDFNDINGEINTHPDFVVNNNIKEYPVTSVLIKSIKLKEEVVNLSPDFFTYSSVKIYIDNSDYININFHSFSIFGNRFARENHRNIFRNNIIYLILEKPLLKILNLFGLEVINHNTIFRKSLIVWLENIQKLDADICFFGE